MTIGTLQNIRQLNEEGANGLETSEILGLPAGVVYYWLKVLGLEPVKRNRTKKRYKVTDVWTEKVLCSGTARECAEALGIDIDSLREHHIPNAFAVDQRGGERTSDPHVFLRSPEAQ